jgi:tetratricopeptide (TPR) repeat protein
MKCEICLEKFNLSTRVPYVISFCGHTFCSQCLDNISTCAICRQEIFNYAKNWTVIKEICKFNDEKRNSAKYLNDLGLNLIKENNLDKAINLFSKAFYTDESYYDSLKNRAQAYYQTKNYISCICDLTLYSQKCPNDKFAILNLAKIYYLIKDYSNAYLYFEQFSLIDQNVYVFIMKARCLIAMKNYRKALLILEFLLQEHLLDNNTLLEVREDKLNTYYGLKNYEKCLETMSTIIDMRGSAYDYYVKARVLAMGEFNYDEIIECLDNAIYLNNKFIKAYKMKANLIIRNEKNFLKYVQTIKECLLNNPMTRIDYLFNLN